MQTQLNDQNIENSKNITGKRRFCVAKLSDDGIESCWPGDYLYVDAYSPENAVEEFIKEKNGNIKYNVLVRMRDNAKFPEKIFSVKSVNYHIVKEIKKMKKETAKEKKQSLADAKELYLFMLINWVCQK